MRMRGSLVALVLTLAAGCGSKPAEVVAGTPPGPAAQPASTAVAVGAKAPTGQLARATGEKVALADVLHDHARTIVVFYRGFW